MKHILTRYLLHGKVDMVNEMKQNEPCCPKCGKGYKQFRAIARTVGNETEGTRWEEWTECGGCGTEINEDEFQGDE